MTLKKVLKVIAIGYYWLCLAILVIPLTISIVAITLYYGREPDSPLIKASLDGKFLAKLSGGKYDVKFVWDKPDPKYPGGIYIKRKGSHEKILVAQQNSPQEQFEARDVDVRWEPNDKLVIVTTKSFSLVKSHLIEDGQKIEVSFKTHP